MPALQNHAQRPLGRTAQAADRLRAQCLVHAGAGQHFPVYQHARRRPRQRNPADSNPGGHGGGRLRQYGHLVYGVRAADPGVLHGGDRSAVRQSALAAGAQRVDGPGAVPVQNLVHGGNFPRRGAGQLRQADGLRRYRHRQQLRALLPVLPAAGARFPVRGSALAVAGHRTGAASRSPADGGAHRHAPGRALLRLLHGDPAGQSGTLPALPHQRLRAPPPQPAVDAGAAGDLHHAVYPGQPDADHGDRGAGQQDEFHHHGGGDPAVGGRLLSGGDGDFHRQYHGAVAENAGDRLAVLGCQRQEEAACRQRADAPDL
ncbi:Uncharacterised protein [Serratia marcescens]|nr:Uncharacterised protein [Serratia marcescens]